MVCGVEGCSVPPSNVVYRATSKPKEDGKQKVHCCYCCILAHGTWYTCRKGPKGDGSLGYLVFIIGAALIFDNEPSVTTKEMCTRLLVTAHLVL